MIFLLVKRTLRGLVDMRALYWLLTGNVVTSYSSHQPCDTVSRYYPPLTWRQTTPQRLPHSPFTGRSHVFLLLTVLSRAHAYTSDNHSIHDDSPSPLSLGLFLNGYFVHPCTALCGFEEPIGIQEICVRVSGKGQLPVQIEKAFRQRVTEQDWLN